MPPDTIAIEGLTKAYGTRTALRALDLRVPRGTLCGFLGPNGAGKTTAIRVLLGFLRPDRGQASVLGRDCWRESRSVKRDVGYVPGDLRLFGWMRGIDALRLAGRTRGFLSPMHFYRPHEVVQGHGWPVRDLAVLGLAATALWVAGGLAFARRDLRTT